MSETPRPEEEPKIQTEIQESKIEEELSSEEIEKVLEKVQDINQEGTATHGLGYSDTKGDLGNREERFARNLAVLEVVLHTGLIARAPINFDARKLEGTLELRKLKAKEELLTARNLKPERRKEMWKSTVGVFFHIKHPDRDEWNFSHPDNVTIIFDYEKLKKKLTGRRAATYSSKTPLQEAGEGAVKNRIAPRFFRGIVLTTHGAKIRRDGEKFVWDEFPKLNQEIIEKRIDEIVDASKKTFREKHNLYIPIYDNDGNLYWPKQMSYEDVKKFAEERDKDNKE